MFPIKDVKEEDKNLKNFIWKPKDRPASKEEIINPPKKAVVRKDAPKKGAAPTAKPGAKSPANAGGRSGQPRPVRIPLGAYLRMWRHRKL